MKFIALLGAFLLHESLACHGCEDAKAARIVAQPADDHGKWAHQSNVEVKSANWDIQRGDDRRLRRDNIRGGARFGLGNFASRETYSSGASNGQRYIQGSRTYIRQGRDSQMRIDNRYDRGDRLVLRTDSVGGFSNLGDNYSSGDIGMPIQNGAFQTGYVRQPDRIINADGSYSEVSTGTSSTRVISAVVQPSAPDAVTNVVIPVDAATSGGIVSTVDTTTVAVQPTVVAGLQPTAVVGCVGEGCVAQRILEGPAHRVQSFDIEDKHTQVSDFTVEDSTHQQKSYDNAARKNDNEVRAKQVASDLASFKQSAIQVKADRLDAARKLADDSDMASIRMKTVDLPVVTTTFEEPTYYQARMPTLAVPNLPGAHPTAKPYVFNEKVCVGLNCKLIPPKEECTDKH